MWNMAGVEKKIHDQFIKDQGKGIAIASGLIMYLSLFGFIFLILSIMSTRSRILSFLEQMNKPIPMLSKVVLFVPAWEYMLFCMVAAVLLISKERSKNKALTLVLNVATLVTIWIAQLIYIWAATLPFIG